MYEEKIKCMICGKETTQINHAHLKIHGLTSSQYREMFPNAKMRVFSKKQKELARERMINWNKSDDGRKSVSERLKGAEKSELHKLKLRDAKAREDKSLRAKINGDNRRGKPQPKDFVKNMKINYGGVFRGVSGTRSDLGHYCRSRWEANYARILKYKNIDYLFESKTFLINLPNGGQSTYTPDFYIPEQDTYIEVKGYWMDHAKFKYELFRQQYPHINVEVIDGEKYKKYEIQFKSKIKEWE